jgi:isopropylmalate/homocitrate/citramalate synthase
MLKERTTYEIMDPTDVGWEGTRLVLGKHSGRAGFRNTLQEIGIRLDEDQLNEAYQRFLTLADRKKAVTAADLVALVSDQLEVADDPSSSSAGMPVSARLVPRPVVSSSLATAKRSAAMAKATAR